MGTAYKKQAWSLRAGGLVKNRPPVQGAGANILRGKTGSFNEGTDENLDFPVYYCVENRGPALVPPTKAGSVRFGTKSSLLRLPKTVLVSTFHLFDAVCTNTGLRDHFRNMLTPLADALAPFGIQVFDGAFDFEPSIAAAQHSSPYVGGDCYFIEIQDSLKDSSLVDRWHRQYHPDNFPHGTRGLDFTDTNFGQPPLEPGLKPAIQVYEDYIRQFTKDYAAAVARFRNFHGLKCYCPGPHEAVLVPTPAFDAGGGQEPTPPCPLTALLLFHTTPPSAAIDYWYYDLPRYAEQDASLDAFAQLFVSVYNGVATPTKGDASWEALQIAGDTDVSFFAQKVKAWFGVG